MSLRRKFSISSSLGAKRPYQQIPQLGHTGSAVAVGVGQFERFFGRAAGLLEPPAFKVEPTEPDPAPHVFRVELLRHLEIGDHLFQGGFAAIFQIEAEVGDFAPAGGDSVGFGLLDSRSAV